MNVTIIGAGNIGRALAGPLVRTGHNVVLTSKEPRHAAEVAREAGAHAIEDTAAAARDADVVVLAVPYAAGEQIADEIREAVRGKVVIDVTNPIKPTYDGLATEGGPSAAERFAAWLPEARVAKALNTVFASNIADPTADGVRLDGFVAADDPEAKATALELLGSLGFRPIDAGPLARARELESLAWFGMALQPTVGNTWHTGWKLAGVPETAPPEPAASR
jgi:NADPH-dependent F420 reductase